MHHSDDLYLGAAVGPYPSISQDAKNPSYMPLGIGPMGRVYGVDVVPLTLNTAAYAAAQAVAGAGNLTLVAGTGVTQSTAFNGALLYTADVSRGVQVVSSNAGDTTQTVTVSGYDFTGQTMTERLTLNGTTPVLGKKAFKSVFQAAVSAATAGNVSMGTTDKIGIPIAIFDAAYVIPRWNNTLAQDAGTLVNADVTSPATVTTGDVRGTYTPSSATNGTKRLVLLIYARNDQAGPGATRVQAFGVNQV